MGESFPQTQSQREWLPAKSPQLSRTPICCVWLISKIFFQAGTNGREFSSDRVVPPLLLWPFFDKMGH